MTDKEIDELIEKLSTDIEQLATRIEKLQR